MTLHKQQKRIATKKEQILSYFSSGIVNVEKIARLSGASSTYVASVLQKEGLIEGYFDLYTPTDKPMNVYSRLFANRLGFKTKRIAERSVDFLSRFYSSFKKRGDRVGQHYALEMALTMFERAKGIGKNEEAEVYRKWIIYRLEEEAYLIT